MSFRLTDYIEPKVIFETLEALPAELQEAREDLWIADRERRDAALLLDNAQRVALQEHADAYADCRNNEQRDQFKWELFTNDGSIVEAETALREAEDSLSKAKDRLADKQDKFSAVRNTIRLIQTVGGFAYAEAIEFEMQMRQEREIGDNADNEIPF
jgi:hypothetical protein